MTYTESELVDQAALTEFVIRLFSATGMPREHSTPLANNLVDADLHGVTTHGVVRVPGYVDQLRKGDVDPHAQVRLEARSEASALLDGGGTFGAIGGTQAIEWGIAAARDNGIAMCGATNIAHFGAAGYFARLAATNGMVGIAMTSTPPAIATAGGIDPRLGNNPLAIAAPGPDRFSLDIAMSVVSRGRVKLFADAGKALPEGWAIDADGQPTTDAQAALNGSLLPFGGYKGAGLALAVEILSAALTGAQLTQQSKPSGFTATGGQPGSASASGRGSVTVGQLFVVINPGIFRPLQAFERDVRQIVDYVKQSQTLPGEQVMIAGEQEAEIAAERRRDGIPIPGSILKRLDELASDLSVGKLAQAAPTSA